MIKFVVLDWNWRYYYEWMVLDIEIKVWLYVCVYILYFLVFFMKGFRSIDIMVLISIFSIKILIFKY